MLDKDILYRNGPVLDVSDAVTRCKLEECFAEFANPCKRRRITHRHDATNYFVLGVLRRYLPSDTIRSSMGMMFDCLMMFAASAKVLSVMFCTGEQVL